MFSHSSLIAQRATAPLPREPREGGGGWQEAVGAGGESSPPLLEQPHQAVGGARLKCGLAEEGLAHRRLQGDKEDGLLPGGGSPVAAAPADLGEGVVRLPEIGELEEVPLCVHPQAEEGEGFRGRGGRPSSSWISRAMAWAGVLSLRS